MLYLSFFLSGIAGLVYEVVWARYLALYIGGTGIAQLVVIATFMAGLAIGNHIFGSRSDTVKSAILLYVTLQAGVGICALLFHPVFLVSRDILYACVRSANPDTGILPAVKILAAVLTIFLPGILMGGTMPPLVKHLVRNNRQAGRKIAVLYFLNSVGGAAGCVLAGFILVRTLGLQHSMTAGAILNFAAAGIALAGLKKTAPASSDVQEAESPDREVHKSFVQLVLACVFLSGAVAMLYEVAWIRLLTLVVGGSTYSFPLMLATFILGLGLGGFILSLKKNSEGYPLIFAWAEIGAGLSVLLAIPFYSRLPYIFNRLASRLPREDSAFDSYQLCKFIICASVMIVPAILLGIALPAAAKIAAGKVQSLGKRVGTVFAVNTAGAIAGVCIAGLAGLPLLGIKGTIEVGAAVNCAIGAMILLKSGTAGKRRYMILAALCIIGCWTWYLCRMEEWDRALMASGAYRLRGQETRSALVRRAGINEILFYRDGSDATVSVVESKGPSRQRILLINGKPDASTEGDLLTQKMIAHLPLICRPNIEKILVVGLGSGATVGSVLAHDVREVDVVEISPEVIEASRLFESVNGRFREDSRAKVFCEDARTWLLATGKKYDVIISEPTNPWVAGVPALFSREYFIECRDHLAPKGLFLTWIQASEFNDASYYMILETFSRIFPYYTIWNLRGRDTAVIGCTDPYSPDFELMRRRFSSPSVMKDLELVDVRSMLSLLSMQMCDRARSPSYVSWLGAEHSDFHPKLDYLAPRAFFTGSSATGAAWMDDRDRSPANSRLWISECLRDSTVTAAEFKQCYSFAKTHNTLYRKNAYTWALEWQKNFPDEPDARRALREETKTMHIDLQPNAEAIISEDDAKSLSSMKQICLMAFDDYLLTKTCFTLPLAPDLQYKLDKLAKLAGENDSDLCFWTGILAFDRGQYETAVENLKSCLPEIKNDPGRSADMIMAAEALCRSLLALGRHDEALLNYDEYLADGSDKLNLKLLRSLIKATVRRRTL